MWIAKKKLDSCIDIFINCNWVFTRWQYADRLFFERQ